MSVETHAQTTAVRLLMNYRGALYSYIYACVRNHADAEDLLQDVSVAVVGSFSQLASEEEFLPWAREIARRRILAHARKTKKELSMDPQVISALAEASGRVTQRHTVSCRRDALLECLGNLPASSRELLMHYYSNSAAQVGEIEARFGKRMSAIYAEVHRMRCLLRDCASRRLQKDSLK